MPALIGNKRTFAIELVPVSPSWELRYAPEAQAWAGLAVWIDDRNICSHVQPGSAEIDEYLFVPLGPIADWLVRSFPALRFEERAACFPTGQMLHRDVRRWGKAQAHPGLDEDRWFDAREAWWSRHFVRAGAEGARLPDVAMVRDDERLVLTWAKPAFVGGDAPVMVWPDGASDLPWLDGAEVLERFVRFVGDAFAEEPVPYAWARLQHPLREQSFDLETAVELFVGRDLDALETLTQTSDAAQALAALGLRGDSLDPAASPHCQMLRDLSRDVSREIGELVLETGANALASDEERRASWLAGRALALDAARAAATAEEAGEFAADEIRRRLALDGEPVSDVDEFVSQFGAMIIDSETDGSGDRMMTCAQLQGSPWITTMKTPRTESPWGRRFEQARGLGHLLLDPIRAGAIGAASGPYSQAARRSRSGAFAANLLLPTTALADASGGSLDGIARGEAFEHLLERFGIGARAAAYQLWNQHWLSSPALRDELIDRFAYRG